MGAQNRVESLLQAVDERGQRRCFREQLKSLALYIDATNGEGSAAQLAKTPPPPPELLGARLTGLTHGATKTEARATRSSVMF